MIDLNVPHEYDVSSKETLVVSFDYCDDVPTGSTFTLCYAERPLTFRTHHLEEVERVDIPLDRIEDQILFFVLSDISAWRNRHIRLRLMEKTAANVVKELASRHIYISGD